MQAFKAGRDLYKAGRFVEACIEFERSQQLEPQFGTLFNLAQCLERIGRLASALTAYRELGEGDTNAARKAAAAGRAATVDLRVPKLVVQLARLPRGLEMSLEGKAGSRAVAHDTPVGLDFGEYELVVRAPGFEPLVKTVAITEEGRTTTLVLELVASSTSDPKAATPAVTAPAPRSRRKAIGIGTLATGVAAIGGGVVFGVLARSQWNDAKAICGGVVCTTQSDLDRANQLVDRARLKGNVSTGLVAGGGVLAAIGLVLWMTAPATVRITPHATDRSAGMTVDGRF